MFGQTTATLSSMESSMSIDDDFFSVAITIPFEAAGGRCSVPDDQNESTRDLKPTFDT